MDNDYPIDLDEIRRAIASAPVVVVRFPALTRRLLIDTRSTDEEGPLIALVGRVQSVEERFRQLQAMRPAFEPPERIVSFVWPRTIRALQQTGIWDAIVDRLSAGGHPGVMSACAAALSALLREEASERLAAVAGHGYRTVWQRSG